MEKREEVVEVISKWYHLNKQPNTCWEEKNFGVIVVYDIDPKTYSSREDLTKQLKAANLGVTFSPRATRPLISADPRISKKNLAVQVDLTDITSAQRICIKGIKLGKKIHLYRKYRNNGFEAVKPHFTPTPPTG